MMLKEFVYLIRPTRENIMDTMTQEESEIMDQHFEYLKDLLEKEQLIMAGPCLDAAFGICVIAADSWDSAQKIMENDPAVSNGVMNSELHPYRVSLLKGR
jgi:uncharacterized protein YciI